MMLKKSDTEYNARNESYLYYIVVRSGHHVKNWSRELPSALLSRLFTPGGL